MFASWAAGLTNTPNVPPAAEENHSDSDCFLLVFLSHGENDQVYTYDGKISVQDITSLFKGDKCKSLVGKPKIFILQVRAFYEKPGRIHQHPRFSRQSEVVWRGRRRISPGVPRRQARRPGDRVRRCGQRAEDQWGGGGRQRSAHPPCRGRLHHVLLCGRRWGSPQSLQLVTTRSFAAWWGRFTPHPLLGN